MRKPQPVERPIDAFWWCIAIIIIILWIDPLQDFVENVFVLAACFFWLIIRKCPDQLKLLHDARARLDQHRDELEKRRG
jgi:hypothetical protein